MKKIFLMMVALICGYAISYADKKKKEVIKIYIGAESIDGSGLGWLSWGGGCKSGNGICLSSPKSVALNDDDVISSDHIILVSQNELDVVLVESESINKIENFIENENFKLSVKTKISNVIMNQLEGLVENGNYYIDAGYYKISRNEGKITLHLKLNK